jgi:hypothetical protein
MHRIRIRYHHQTRPAHITITSPSLRTATSSEQRATTHSSHRYRNDQKDLSTPIEAILDAAWPQMFRKRSATDSEQQ